ncbi:MAG: hypothetical protein H0W62_02800 [Chitinophagales bacterium]|nr:hypothetical protein [Chitinophagales bacterium]
MKRFSYFISTKRKQIGINTIILIISVACFSCTQKKQITFSADIAPVIYKNCTNCHRAGQAGLIPLVTYEDVSKRSKTIAAVVEKHLMPPWPADPSYTHFCDELVLSDPEISMIKKWSEEGAPAGDLSKLPPLPDFDQRSLIGKPDVTLRIKPFLIEGDNTDRFMVMKIPFELPRDTFIRAVEFMPGSPYVHHVNGHIICYEEGKKKDIYAGRYVINTEKADRDSVFQEMSLLNDDGSNPILINSVTNYLPGVLGTIYPDGIGGFAVKKRGIIYLNDIHYGPSAEAVSDTSFLNIFYGKKPPVRPTMEIQLGTLGISDIIPPLIIPADSVKKFVTRAKILGDISLLTVNPHMHLLGKSFISYAVKPSGDTIPIIRIKSWDFRWQYFYTFPKMVHIPAGSTIEVIAAYDNTVNNPNNPFNPPQTVEGRNGSMKTTQEMLQLILTYLPYEKGDEDISLETK